MSHQADPSSRLSKMHIPGTCAKCHAAVAESYAGSIHAEAVRKGQTDAPVCTDCHGEHDILLHTDPRSPVAAGNVSARVCSPCHSSVALTEKYGIASDRFQTFADSYHGLAIRGGSIAAANCASCHGAHDIRPSSDPASSVNPANLKATCGQCHPGANQRFAEGQVHVRLSEEDEPLLYWIATAYITLIIVVVGGMFAHNLGDFIRKTIRRLRIRSGEYAAEPTDHTRYLRMSLNERLQHAALGLSFIVLVITGFMLRYPEAWWVIRIRGLSDRVFELRGILHRIAGVLMVGASLWHVGYLAGTIRGRRLVRDLVPGARDVIDGLVGFGHNLGLTSKRPMFGRFGYVEKSEYWALVWGTIVMAVTGVIMWFEDPAIRLLGKLGWDVARTIHFYEAWLAALAILVWHIYYVIFNPDVYPMSTAFLTGKITESEMAEEHPLELAEIKREQDAAARQREEQERVDKRA
jgi:cytochrome b subunit of formate dehydrogenase